MKPQAWQIAYAACWQHYGVDISSLEPHERAAVRNAVQAAMDETKKAEVWEAAAVIKLREIHPEYTPVGLAKRA